LKPAVDAVTVLADGYFQCQLRHRTSRAHGERGSVQHNTGIAVYCDADEGLTWCRGWEGEAVEALKAAVMLTRDPLLPVRASRMDEIGKMLQRLHGRRYWSP
jgi:hypothetical protein